MDISKFYDQQYNLHGSCTLEISISSLSLVLLYLNKKDKTTYIFLPQNIN